jgi:5'-nucleotidase
MQRSAAEAAVRSLQRRRLGGTLSSRSMDAAPLILVSNDDGIHADGIVALAQALKPLGEIVVVAPDREQSAMSHALTLHRPLRVNARGEGQWAVDGTPTDCVNLAINGVLMRKPTLVVSGINAGANLGDDVTYSGTVSAAMEGTLLGVPSIAVSLVGRHDFEFAPAARFAAELAARVMREGLPPDTLLNVNVPQPPDGRALAGVAVTRMGRRRYSDAIIEKIDPRGKKYYWIGGAELDFEEIEGTDYFAIARDLISITPIHMDLTNYRSLELLSGLSARWS